MQEKFGAIVLGAGKGTRMKSPLPKVMMPVCQKPMIRHIMETLENMGAEKVVTVISEDGDLVKKEVAPHLTAVQHQQLGTANAVLSAKEQMKDYKGPVLVVFGDTPLITERTFTRIINTIEQGFAVVVLGFNPEDAGRYGRLKMKGDELLGIVEYKDASEEERKIGFCNSGCMGFDGKYLFDILECIKNENAAQEYYLTDAVEVARQKGLKCTAIEGNVKEVSSANTQEELKELEKFYEERANW